MRALRWYGKGDVRVEQVRDPEIEDPRDIIIKVTSAAICGSDLHLYNGLMPAMKEGDIIGHESMGIVVETGREVKNLKKGDRVIVPFNLACGNCFFCNRQLFSCCDNSNPNAEKAEEAMGHSPSGLLGYSHLLGGYSGGQAEYLRVPFGDIGPLKVETSLEDEQLLFLSDILPTGYMAAENAQIEAGDTVAVWGAGPVGQFVIQSCWMLGAERVIVIDCVEERLNLARTWGKAETINFEEKDVYETLQEMTLGMGPDRCIDAVGAESHGASSISQAIDGAKSTLGLESDRTYSLSQAIIACRKAGTISIPGVYIGSLDDIPFGALMNKGLTVKTGQTHTHKYMRPLLDKIVSGEIDPVRVITHRMSLEEGPTGYQKFRDKEDGCIKVVLKP